MTIKDQIVPVWNQMLGSLDGWLTKAETHAKGDALLQARLAEDMYELAVQLRFVCNMPGEAMVKLGGIAFASSEESPATLAEARERIATTRTAIDEWAKLDFVPGEAPIELALPNGMTFDLTAEQYVRDWALAQFYFHITVAYAILRKEGLDLGKADYVPYMFKYFRQPATA